MKNKILSFTGRSLRGRRLNDPEITRKSPGNHPLITPFGKVMTIMVLLFTFAIGNVWADETYYLQTPGAATPALTGDFYTTATLNQAVTCSYDAVNYSQSIKFSSTTGTSTGNFTYTDRCVRYDCRTNNTKITVVAYSTNASKKVCYWHVTQAALGSAGSKSSVTSNTTTANDIQTYEYTITEDSPSSFYVGTDNNAVYIVQIKAEEKGAIVFPRAGADGYVLNFNKGRVNARSGAASIIDGTALTGGIEIHQNQNYEPGNTATAKMQTNNTNYIKFNVANPVLLKFTTSSTTKYNVSKTKGSSDGQITPTANVAQSIPLKTAGTYYINPQGSNVTPTGMAFEALYVVTYAANGGGGSMDADYGYGGETMTLAANEFEAPENMEFDAWVVTKTASGNPVTVTDGKFTMPAEAVTVTATWKPLGVKYDITYNKGAYGAGEIASAKKDEGVAFTLSSERFTRSGYVQVGWATTDGGVKAYDLGGSYTTDAAQEFFPVWAETSTYVASFACGTSAPAGWTFSNAGTYGDTDATVDYVCNFVTAGTSTPKQDPAEGKDGTTVNDVAFAKNTAAIATYDLGAATTVTALNVTLCGGSGSDFNETIEYIGADGTTVKKVYENTLSAGNWNDNLISKTDVVSDVRYIRIHGASKWIAMKAFSVTYVDLITKYNVSFDKNDEGASGTQATLKYAEDAEVTLPACTFDAPEGKEFDAWISDDVTISANKFTMPDNDVTIKATWKSACALNPTVSATTLGTTSYTTQVVNCAGISVLGSAGCTISEYGFVYGTTTAPTISDNKKALEGDYTVAGTAFAETTLSGLASNTKYYVRAFATNSHGTAYGEEISFTTLAPLGNVLVVASSAGQTSDAITAMRNAGFVVTVSAPNSSRDYSGYDLVVLDESLDGKNGVAGNEEGDIKSVNIPLLNLKAFFYTLNSRWNWGAPVNGTAANEIANIPTTYKNAQSHPIFEGLTITDGSIDLIDPAKTGNTLQGVTTNTLVSGKEGYTLATSGEGTTFIHELTPDQRGVTDAKYLMVAFANNAKDNLSADGELLIVNAAKYLIGSTAWVPQYYTVSFEAHGDSDPSQLTGKTITLPEATNGSATLLGWYTAETGGTKIGEAGDSYTPTADITLHAQWESVSTDTRISALSYTIGGGSPVNIYEADENTFNVALPYAQSYGEIVVSATPNHAAATIKGGAVLNVNAVPGSATFTIVAQSGAEENYTVNFTKGPKDGVEIIGVVTNGGNSKTVSGLYQGDATVNLDSNKKLGEGRYIYVTLASGYTFEETDVLVVDVAAKSDLSGGNKALEITTGVGNIDGAMWKSIAFEDYTTGENTISLTGIAEGQTSIGLKRSSNQNAFINGLKVYRPMNPILTAITINGVDCEKGTGNVFSVTLPNGTNLGSLTVVPTIVKNGEGGSAAPTAAWAWDENTYRVTDKDGDYTDYTITLTEAAAPSAASVITAQPEGADYIEGASIAELAIVATGSGELSYQWYLGAESIEGATAATYAPSVSAVGSYVYHCVVTNTEAGHPATSLASDNATITISEDPNAIKLINKSTGAINTTNFITGVTATEVNSEEAAAWSNTQGTFAGINNLTKLVQYNATTTKTKVSVKLYSTNSNAKEVYLHKILEGSTTDVVETIPVSSNTPVEAEYTFDNAKNRSIYLATNSTDVKILQVKVVESGEALPMFGQAGYSLNLNKGRIASAKDVDMTFEGMAYKISSAYGVINSTEFKVKSADGNPYKMTFTVNTPVAMTITESGSNYYVYKVAEPLDKGTANTAGTKEYDLTAGTWVIESATTSEAKFTNIAFELPKAEKPVIATQPASNHTFDQGDMTATVVAAEPTEGTLSYQWYNASDDSEVDGATDATLTTITEGTYYVIVTNSLADHQDNSTKSAEATLGYRVTNDATLMALSYGGTAITLEDGVYNYNVELAKGTTNVPALAATATMDGYADVDINDAAEFVNYEASSTVTVKSEDETETLVYTVNFYVKHDLPQVDVTESTTWNWANAAETMQKILPETKDVEQLMANIDDEGKQLKNDAEFNSQALIFSGQEALEKSGSGANTRWFAKGGHIKFNVTVPGIVEVEFSDNGNNNRRVKINDAVSTVASASNTDVKTYKAYVQPGEVMLMGVKNDGTGTDQYIRISKIIFTANPTPDYTRNVTNNIGTLCVDHNVLAGGALGATFYQIASRNELYDYKIDFEEVLPNEELKAGEPYIFKSTTGRIDLFFGNTEVEDSVVVRGMYGVLHGGKLEIKEENMMDVYYIQDNKLRDCSNLISSGLNLVANRAYIVMSEVPTYAEYQALQQQQNSAPRRRVTLGKDAEQIATGFENINAGDKPMKLMINGQIFILRGEKVFDATGRLVK